MASGRHTANGLQAKNEDEKMKKITLKILLSVYKYLRDTKIKSSIKYPIIWKIERLYNAIDQNYQLYASLA